LERGCNGVKAILPVLLAVALCAFAAPLKAADAKPNILFILAGDPGMAGVGCYGADSHKTPNLDRLARSGMRSETCRAAPRLRNR